MDGRAAPAVTRQNGDATDALPLLHIPGYDGLSRAQQRGAGCVWCAVVLTPATAVSLGSRTFSGPYEWRPRGCKTCAGSHALRAMHEHAPRCEQCVDDVGECAAGLGLLRLMREGRRP